jgi:sulfate permease, SulP family
MDTSGLDALEQLHRALKKRGITLWLAAVNEQPLSLMQRAGFGAELGDAGIAPTLAEAVVRAGDLARD